jgi:5-methylcytosine-specific restriction endonuclease McrA
MDTLTLPKTRKEAQVLGVSHYFTGKPCCRGHIAPRRTKGSCTECDREDTLKVAARRADYFAQYNASEKGKDNKRKHYEAHREEYIERASLRNAATIMKYRKTWKERNVDAVRVDTSMRRRRHRDATPAWLTEKERSVIRKLYGAARQMTRDTGIAHVVDHLVPLRHPLVCGLHVPWNLRVISAEENNHKHNHLDELDQCD